MAQTDNDEEPGVPAPTEQRLAFPSLDDSPLLKDDPPPAAHPAPKAAEVPPMDIVRTHFPRIAKTIEMTWGSRELEGYLARLVISDREARQGFPPVVLEALLKVSRQHAQQFGFDDNRAPGADPYSHNAFRKR